MYLHMYAGDMLSCGEVWLKGQNYFLNFIGWYYSLTTMAQNCRGRRCFCFSRRRREAAPPEGKKEEEVEERQLCVVRPRPLPMEDVDEVAKAVIDSFKDGDGLAAHLPCPRRRYAVTARKESVRW